MDTELQSLRGTLAEVDQLLELSQDNSADLLSLKEDLAHLIELKEADLLERSKQTALAAVASALGSLSVPEPANEGNDATPSSQAVDPSTVSPPEEELLGTKCSLPGWTSRGYFVHRNAVIAEVLNEGSLTSRRVRLFFTNPTRLSEVPCAQFLDTGTCSRGSRCRQSHGEVASVEDLQAWEEPDPVSYLREGQLCLALGCDNPSFSSVWHHARIQHTDVDEGTCVVQWCAVPIPAPTTSSHRRSGLVRPASYSLLDASVSSLPLSHVHPISSEDSGEATEDPSCLIDSGEEDADLLASSDSDDDTLSDAGSPSSGAELTSKKSDSSSVVFSRGGVLVHPVEYPMVVSAGDDNADQEPLGTWELHTRGVGSRLLRQMGYTGRGGLGRLGDGRRQPVSSDVTLHCIVDLGGVARPSLDRLVQLRRGKRPVGNRRHRQRCRDAGKVTAAGGFRQAARLLAPSPTVFDYLNSKVLAASSSTHLPAPKTPTISGKSRKQLNIEHYNIQREITLVESEIARAEESLKRNQSRDRLAAASASQRLQSLRTKLASLRNHERALSRETAKQKNKEKLCVF